MKRITLENLHKTKLSDLVESVVYDIERVQRHGFEIDMTWWTNKSNGKCCVCLGGAAACGFLPDEKLSKVIHEGD